MKRTPQPPLDNPPPPSPPPIPHMATWHMAHDHPIPSSSPISHPSLEPSCNCYSPHEASYRDIWCKAMPMTSAAQSTRQAVSRCKRPSLIKDKRQWLEKAAGQGRQVFPSYRSTVVSCFRGGEMNASGTVDWWASKGNGNNNNNNNYSNQRGAAAPPLHFTPGLHEVKSTGIDSLIPPLLGPPTRRSCA
ncbi:unnamed protein product [Cutaneotrichosporon oleaginosum]